jgi:hypothetical protein
MDPETNDASVQGPNPSRVKEQTPSLDELFSYRAPTKAGIEERHTGHDATTREVEKVWAANKNRSSTGELKVASANPPPETLSEQVKRLFP